MSLLGKIGVIGTAVSFARSERGQKLIADARRKYDTPETRERVRQGLEQATSQVRKAAAGRRSTA